VRKEIKADKGCNSPSLSVRSYSKVLRRFSALLKLGVEADGDIGGDEREGNPLNVD
jgi:hypothetical protein